MRHALAVPCPGCNQPIEVLLSVNHGPRWGNTHVTLDRPINHVCQEDPMTKHADRDGSEQPIVWPPKQRRDAQAKAASAHPETEDPQMPERLTDADLDALDELIAAATPSPWNFAPAPNPDAEDQSKAGYVTGLLTDSDDRLWTTFAADPEGDPEDYVVPALTGDGPTSEANAAFIANARNLLPLLLAEVREVRGLGTSRPVSARAAHASGGEAVEPVRASVAQVEAAMSTWDRVMPLTGGVTLWQAVADAVVAAGPDEDVLESAMGEIERLRAKARELEEHGRKRTAHGLRERNRADRAEAERDRLAATVERVEALAKHTREVHAELPQPHGPWTRGYEIAIRDLLAILDDPATTPGTPHAPAGRDESVSGQSGEAGPLGGAEKRNRGPGAATFNEDGEADWFDDDEGVGR
jgi:hypothetical protein